MADVAVRSSATTAVPDDYKIPGAQELLPRSVRAHMDGSSTTSAWFPCLQVLDPAGNVLVDCVSQLSVAAGVSADVSWFPGLKQCPTPSQTTGATIETFFFDTVTAVGTTVFSSTTLATSVLYTVTIQGTYSEWNQALTVGTPNADALYPGSTVGRLSTQVGIDPECCFASPVPSGPGPITVGQHTDNILLTIGGTLAHIEPVGGPFSTPQSNYAYTYLFTGQGSKLGIANKYSPTTDNYGKLLVTIQGGTGGGGSLLPPTNAGNNGEVMLTAAGIPAWGNVDGGSP